MTGSEMIAAERQRQIEAEGYSSTHDQEHRDKELVYAAITYLTYQDEGSLAYWTWPWDREYFKPTPDDRLRELAKAGALIAAEIDRLSATAKGAE